MAARKPKTPVAKPKPPEAKKRINWPGILGHGLFTTVISLIAGGGVSYLVAVSTVAPAQDRQMRLEAAVSFGTSSDEFISIGTQVIPRLSASLDLAETKLAIADASGRQATSAEALIPIFGADLTEEARNYQQALGRFVDTTNGLNSPEQIKEWGVAFDQVVTATYALKASMSDALDVKSLNAS